MHFEKHHSLGLLLGVTVILLLSGPWVRVVHNATDSAPKGFYVVHERQPRVGDWVVFKAPQDVASLVHARAYVPNDTFLKRVVAEPGQQWSVSSNSVFTVEGQTWGRAHTYDSLGRALPIAFGAHVVPPEHILVATRHPRSFDSRYFGAVPTQNVVGVAEALWIYSH